MFVSRFIRVKSTGSRLMRLLSTNSWSLRSLAQVRLLLLRGPETLGFRDTPSSPNPCVLDTRNSHLDIYCDKCHVGFMGVHRQHSQVRTMVVRMRDMNAARMLCMAFH